jgi:phosphoglycolate phosphatase
MGIDKQYIIFDLDGTLTDSKLGILKSVQYSLKHFGIEIKDEDFDFYSYFIGPPLRNSFRNHFGFDDAKIEEAVAKFREYLIPIGLYENELYPGIDNLLKKLKDSSKIVMLATSKAEAQAITVLKHFDIFKYFDFIIGDYPGGGRSKKDELILCCLEHYGIISDEEKSTAVMIGDRDLDIIGAAKNGIESIGVLYGYGGEEELLSGEYKADYIVRNVDELTELLI